MQLTVIGSGTCVPSGERGSAAYWIDAGPLRVRLDCGAGSVHGMARHGLPWETLTHQLISHFHLDHVGELPMLLFAFRHGRAGVRREPLTLVGPAGLAELIAGLEATLGQRLLEQEFPVIVKELAPGGLLELAPGAQLAVVATPHTDESLALRLDVEGRSFGYTGDTAPSPDLAAFFRGVDVLLAECSFLDDARGTRHLTADDAADLATAAGARYLVATHCYFDPVALRLEERLARRFAGRVTVAYDGLRVEI